MTTKATSHRFSVNYTKPKPFQLEALEQRDQEDQNEYDPFKIRNLQNYNPTYSLFFELTPQNSNRIALNHPYHVQTTNQIYDPATETTIETPVFIKFSPLLDPIRYMIGKYSTFDESTGSEILPAMYEPVAKDEEQSDKLMTETKDKINGPNNASYVDCFFSYLVSQLLHAHNFIHGTDFYGSFLGIQDKFRMNVVDDLEYLQNSNFFNAKRGKLFELEDGFQSDFPDINQFGSRGNKHKLLIVDQGGEDENPIDLLVDEVLCIEQEHSVETDIIEAGDILLDYEKKSEPRSSRSSSGSTNSSSNSKLNYSTESEDDDEDQDEDQDQDQDENNWTDASSDDRSGSFPSTSDDNDTTYIYIRNFPVQMICMEKCDGTLDELFVEDVIGPNEGASALFQIIMTLITYQKAFQFTHNDLHTNNIMYVNTKEEYLYYVFNKTTYKVPTYGRIFKIIDFGRGIYKYQGKQFCSDSFAPGGDAATQYNFEPFMNKKKPRIEPNYSFDLCRLGTSIFDFIIEEDTDMENLDELQETINRWCLDDAGKNVLYKKNGDERYPNFKLYKMIARTVHVHTPQEQLRFPFFNQFEITDKKAKKISKMVSVMNLDEIPQY
jgi:hypothetical protein